MNLQDIASVEAAVQQTYSTFSGLDILVNSAGIRRDNLVMRMKTEEWEDVISANLTSVFHLSKACLKPMMKARFGRIISISSVVGLTGNFGQANYTAAKAGLIGFSKTLAQEVASRNITVNVVAPGFIDTDMTRSLTEEQKKYILSKIPAARMGQAEDIAAIVCFLASNAAGYITGETVHVNGGMYMP
jgi:3-oxoacyl-[acyl-carrier protein] reductase